MRYQSPNFQIVPDEPRNIYIDPDLESIIMEEERVIRDWNPEEPGCIFDPILGDR